MLVKSAPEVHSMLSMERGGTVSETRVIRVSDATGVMGLITASDGISEGEGLGARVGRGTGGQKRCHCRQVSDIAVYPVPGAFFSMQTKHDGGQSHGLPLCLVAALRQWKAWEAEVWGLPQRGQVIVEWGLQH